LLLILPEEGKEIKIRIKIKSDARNVRVLECGGLPPRSQSGTELPALQIGGRARRMIFEVDDSPDTAQGFTVEWQE
jgi:hypothetical protein